MGLDGMLLLTNDTNASSRLFLRIAGADFDRPGSHLDFKPGQEAHSKQSVDTSAVTLFWTTTGTLVAVGGAFMCVRKLICHGGSS